MTNLQGQILISKSHLPLEKNVKNRYFFQYIL